MMPRTGTRAVLTAGIAAALLAATATGAGAAPRLLSSPPEWVAPGARVALRVAPDDSGVLRLERCIPGGWRVVARRPVRRGGVVVLTHRPREVGVHRLRLVVDPAGAPDAGTADALPLALRVRPITLAALGDISPGSAAATVAAPAMLPPAPRSTKIMQATSPLSGSWAYGARDSEAAALRAMTDQCSMPRANGYVATIATARTTASAKKAYMLTGR